MTLDLSSALIKTAFRWVDGALIDRRIATSTPLDEPRGRSPHGMATRLAERNEATL